MSDVTGSVSISLKPSNSKITTSYGVGPEGLTRSTTTTMAKFEVDGQSVAEKSGVAIKTDWNGNVTVDDTDKITLAVTTPVEVFGVPAL